MRTALLIGLALSLFGCAQLQGMMAPKEAAAHEETPTGVAPASAPVAGTPELELEDETAPQTVYAQSVPASYNSERNPPGQPAFIKVFLTTETAPNLCSVEAEGPGAIVYKCGMAAVAPVEEAAE